MRRFIQFLAIQRLPFQLLAIQRLIIFLLLFAGNALAEPFEISTITDQLHHPWGMAFIQNAQVLVTEKAGTIKKVSLTDGSIQTITGGPKVARLGQGGLLDIEKHPRFNQNRWVYFSYSKQMSRGVTTAVAKATLEGNQLIDLEDIIVSKAISNAGQHFGSRLAFDEHELLYITIGDRGERDNAQRLSSHAGKVLRLHDDGKIPKNNPFLTTPNAYAEIYSYGHRNPQGLAFDKETQRMWLHEHGPKGGDEVNLLHPGANYGWPVITYGKEYSGFSITDETHREGMEQPVWKWVPSIAPSGLAVYRGEAFKNWQGDLLVGALKFKLLAHLTMKGIHVRNEQRYLNSLDERIRAVKIGPDGLVYLLSDSAQGRLIKLSPKNTL